MKITYGKIMNGQFDIGFYFYNWFKDGWELGLYLGKWYIGLESFK